METLVDLLGIYKILSPSGKVYIGQTTVSFYQRWKVYFNMSPGMRGQILILNSLKKYGPEAHVFSIEHILSPTFTQEELDWWELYYYQLYKGVGYTMMNIKEPGRGGRLSEETKKKISKAWTPERKAKMPYMIKGKGNPMYGKSYEQLHGEDRARDIKKLIGIKSSINRLGKKHSDITKSRISINKKAQKLVAYNRKKIYQYDLNGKFIIEWDSITLAGKTLGIIISGICYSANGKYKMAGGFLWSYDKVHRLTKYVRTKSNKPIIQMDLEGNYIAEFESMKEAAKGVGVVATCISAVISGRYKTSGGYTFKLA